MVNQRDLSRIQELQDAYSLLTNLKMIMITQNGEPVTLVSSASVRNIYDNPISIERLRVFASKIKNIKKAIFYDYIPGLKVIVSPIEISEREKYFLLAGFIFEENSKEIIRNYLKQQTNLSAYEQQLEGSETSDQEKEDKYAKVLSLTQHMKNILSEKESKDLEQKKLLGIEEGIENLLNSSSNISFLLERLLESNNGIDFAGVAIQSDNEQFIIEHFSSKDNMTINNKVFSTGEGFLGQAIVMEEFQFWGNIELDPRAMFFQQQEQINPVSLFCSPIMIDGVLRGLLFGGSSRQELQPSSLLVDSAKLYSLLLSIYLKQKHLQDDLNNHLMKLTTFKEIFKVMTTVQDEKRILYILLDMSMNITRSTQICALLKSPDSEKKLTIVSRGLSPEKVTIYCKEIAQQFITNKNYEPTNPAVYEAKDGSLFYVVPILYQKNVLGYLNIRINQNSDIENYQSFLLSLAIAGGISLYLLKDETENGSDKKIFNMLLNILEEKHPTSYQEALKIKNTIEQFASYVKMDSLTLQLLLNSVSLVYYDEKMICNAISNQSIVKLVDEFHRLRESNHDCWAAFSNSSKILYLAYIYIKNENLPEMNDELSRQFQLFLSSLTFVESEFTLGSTSNRENVISHNGISSLKLSNREMDVLNLVLKGYGNKEIALELFISEHTVKNHMTNILQKIGVADRAQAIAKVYQMGYSPVL